MFVFSSHYWLANARVPRSLLVDPLPENLLHITRENLCAADIEVREGKIARVVPAGSVPFGEVAVCDRARGVVFPCFVDIHAHLDKAHIWERTSNPDGTFWGAIAASQADREKYWTPEGLRRRMEFDLKCYYAHGTKAVRTHLDSGDDLAATSWEVFLSLREAWRDRIQLQAVSLAVLDFYEMSEGKKLADRVAAAGGILGGVAYTNPDLERQIERVFQLAEERGLDLDFHVDENGDPESICLQKVAKTAIARQFPGRILCGHCCSLAVQSPETRNETIALVREAQIALVSLPECNLYLQDRQPDRTPRWRGVAPIRALQAAGVPVAIGSDNCRDPFYGFGDRDLLFTFAQAVRIAHLDTPYADVPALVTKIPADIANWQGAGRIGAGLPADLVLFKGRSFSELLSRAQGDRIVLRNGKAIDTALPDYAELDDLMALSAG